MSDQAYEFALRNTLTEIKNICPDVQTSFLFNQQATVIAADADTLESTAEKVVGSLEGILDKVDTIGGLNSIVFEGTKGKVHISRVDDLYLTLITSKKADMKYLQTITSVLVPTVIKLLNNLGHENLRQIPTPTFLEQPEVKLDEELLQEEDEEVEDIVEKIEEVKEKIKKKPKDEMPELELPSSQLIVESFGGFLARGDTVEISEQVMSKWVEDSQNGKINHVEVEAFNGQSKQCRVKALGESKLENSAVIRIPEKICQTLDIKKGELVRVKPLIA